MPPLTRSDSFQDVDFTLRRQFNKTAFRPQQKEIILAALARRDVFVQAATSFGKSLCFQLPAVLDVGITVVISPLLSLMMNQVAHLRASAVDARTLNSQTSPAEREAIYADLASGHPRARLLYVTPELCSTDAFRRRLAWVHEQRELARVVVDEAHCISEWGHDFRRDFKKLSWFRQTFPDVPLMALTATANARVRSDVLATLGMGPPADDASHNDGKINTTTTTNLSLFTMTAHRPNLHLEIRYTSDEATADARFDDFLTWLESVHARRRSPPRAAELASAGSRPDNVSGIIYTTSRSEVDSLAAALRHAGIGARPFHARLPAADKARTLAGWVANEPGYDVVVATTAFGMGIDKADVRFVAHWRLPKSFEGYYQEAGRAGRDGKAAYCFLYYAREDWARVAGMVAREGGSGREGGGEGERERNRRARMESLEALVRYCEDVAGCRHAAVCRYFGEGEEAVPRCDFACDFACDVCKDADGTRRRMRAGLASEEFVSTQREVGAYDGYYSE